MSQVVYYLVNGASVRSVQLVACFHNLNLGVNWIDGNKDKAIYAQSIAGEWFKLSSTKQWVNRQKTPPKIIEMALLVDAIAKITLKEFKDEIPINTLQQGFKGRFRR